MMYELIKFTFANFLFYSFPSFFHGFLSLFSFHHFFRYSFFLFFFLTLYVYIRFFNLFNPCSFFLSFYRFLSKFVSPFFFPFRRHYELLVSISDRPSVRRYTANPFISANKEHLRSITSCNTVNGLPEDMALSVFVGLCPSMSVFVGL